MMKKFTLTLLLLMATFYSAEGQPILRSSAKSFDFGITVTNSTIVYSFWLKSVGTDTVVISDIKTGCLCTTIPLESDRIAPGDSAYLSVFWGTEKSFGKIHRNPRIYSNDSAAPLRIALTADVQIAPDSNLPATIWPFKLEMGRLPQKSIDEMKFRIKNTTDKALMPTVLSDLPGECNIKLPESIPPHGDAWGVISIKQEYLDKDFENSMTVSFNDSRKTILTIPIRRKIYGAGGE